MGAEPGKTCICCGKALNFISGCNRLLEGDQEAVCSSCFSEFGVSYNIFSKTAAPEKLKANYEAALRDIRDAGFKQDAVTYLLNAAKKRFEEKEEELKKPPAPKFQEPSAFPKRPQHPVRREAPPPKKEAPKPLPEEKEAPKPQPAEKGAEMRQSPSEKPGEERFFMTKGDKPEGFRIEEYKGVCLELAVIGLPDVLKAGEGGQEFGNARERALSGLTQQAIRLGANALTELSMEIKSMGTDRVALSFSANAVKITKI